LFLKKECRGNDTEHWLQTDRYEKDGETRYFTRVVARNLIMLGSNREGASPEEDGDSN
jgi:single-stranded DNA-binding protein